MNNITQPEMNSGGHTLLMLNEEDLGVVIERHLKAFFDKYMMTEREPEKPEVYLTETEVQQMLGVTHATLWRWHRDKYLCHQKVGRRCLWRKSDIEKLINP